MKTVLMYPGRETPIEAGDLAGEFRRYLRSLPPWDRQPRLRSLARVVLAADDGGAIMDVIVELARRVLGLQPRHVPIPCLMGMSRPTATAFWEALLPSPAMVCDTSTADRRAYIEGMHLIWNREWSGRLRLHARTAPCLVVAYLPGRRAEHWNNGVMIPVDDDAPGLRNLNRDALWAEAAVLAQVDGGIRVMLQAIADAEADLWR